MVSNITVGTSLVVKNLEVIDRSNEILTKDALNFICHLQNKFGDRRKTLLNQRTLNQKSIDQGALPDFLDSTEHIRISEWKVSSVPKDLQDRRV